MAKAKFVLIPEQPEAPALVGPIPGPKAAEWVARDQQVMSPSYTRDYPLVIDRAIGSVVTDADGNRFLDLTAGIAVTSTGHCHPHVVEAIQKQATRFLHMSGTDFYYDQEILLAERLARLAPMSGKNRVFFTNSGAEAIEAAFKLARHQTGRQHVIAFWGAFHGRTFGAMSLSGSKAIHRKRFMPMVPQITHVTYPNPFRPADLHADRSLTDFTIHEIEHTVFRREVGPDEVAAIFVEPIQGEGGYLIPPADFLPRLRELCSRHGILLVCDEVQCGMGRTGKMWAVEHVGVEPDIIALAKGIASGMPLGAILAREEIMNWPPGSHVFDLRRQPGGLCRCAGYARSARRRADGERRPSRRPLGRAAAQGARRVSGHRRRPRHWVDGRRRFRGGSGKPPRGRRDAEPRCDGVFSPRRVGPRLRRERRPFLSRTDDHREADRRRGRRLPRSRCGSGENRLEEEIVGGQGPETRQKTRTLISANLR